MAKRRIIDQTEATELKEGDFLVIDNATHGTRKINPNKVGKTSYNDLSNRPQINGHTLAGNQTSADLGLMPETEIDTAPTEDSNNLVTSGGVHAAIKDAKDEIGVKLDSHSRRLDNLEAVTSSLYAEDIDTDEAYQKSIPSGALPWGTVDRIGGKTVVWNQLVNNTLTTTTVNGITFTHNEDGSWIVNGTATDVTRFVFTDGGSVPANDKVFVRFGIKNAIGGIVLGRQGFGYTYTRDFIHSHTGEYSAIPQMQISQGITINNLKVHPLSFNLTKMYGSGNEPTTTSDPRIAWIEQYAAVNPEFNAGELVSAKVDNVKSAGVNLCETLYVNQTSAGYQTVLNIEADLRPNTTYTLSFIGAEGNSVYQNENLFTTSTHITITGERKSIVVTTKSNLSKNDPTQYNEHGWRVLKNDSINTVIPRFSEVQIELGSTDTAYKPYLEHNTPIPPAILALPGYGWSAGDVYNYVDFAEKKYHKRVAAVDMGTLDWHIDGNGNFASNAISEKSSERSRILSPIYDTFTNSWSLFISSNKTVFSNGEIVYARDSAYESAASFKSAMSGVMLYYELATEEIIDLSDILTDDLAVKVEAGGTLTFEQVDDVGLAVPNQTTMFVKV